MPPRPRPPGRPRGSVHDQALGRVMTAVLSDETELFRQFTDNEGIRRWLTDTVFGLTDGEDGVPA